MAGTWGSAASARPRRRARSPESPRAAAARRRPRARAPSERACARRTRPRRRAGVGWRSAREVKTEACQISAVPRTRAKRRSAALAAPPVTSKTRCTDSRAGSRTSSWPRSCARALAWISTRRPVESMKSRPLRSTVRCAGAVLFELAKALLQGGRGGEIQLPLQRQRRVAIFDRADDCEGAGTENVRSLRNFSAICRNRDARQRSALGTKFL